MTIVVYKSVTGNTKRYAEMIAAELNGDCIDLKEASKRKLQSYDQVIYGGPVHAGRLAGLKKAKRLAKGKRLIVFACGGDIGRESEVEKVRGSSVKAGDAFSFYYLPGGLDISKLTGFLKFMMDTMYKMMSKKKNKTEDDIAFLKGFEEPTDFVDATHITELI